jgi:hypothetical protein
VTDTASDIICRYQQDIWHMPHVSVSLYCCTGLGPDGIVTKMFLIYLFVDEEESIAGPEESWSSSSRNEVLYQCFPMSVQS